MPNFRLRTSAPVDWSDKEAAATAFVRAKTARDAARQTTAGAEAAHARAVVQEAEAGKLCQPVIARHERATSDVVAAEAAEKAAETAVTVAKRSGSGMDEAEEALKDAKEALEDAKKTLEKANEARESAGGRQSRATADVVEATAKVSSAKKRAEHAEAELRATEEKLKGAMTAGDGHARGLRGMMAAEGQGLPFLGFRIFKWLLLLAGLLLIGLVAIAITTYPDASTYLPSPDATPSPTPASSEQAANWEKAKGGWVTTLKDVGQLFLLTPVFPLIAAVIGYIFGRERPSAESSTKPAAPPRV